MTIKINGLILDGNGANFVGVTMYCAACGEEMPSFQKGRVACQKCGGEEWHSAKPPAPAKAVPCGSDCATLNADRKTYGKVFRVVENDDDQD